MAGIVNELAVAPLPEDRESAVEDYVRGVVRSLVEMQYTRRIADLRSALQRTDAQADPDGYQAIFAELLSIEAQRRELRSLDQGD